jgi:WD40 repeat protein
MRYRLPVLLFGLISFSWAQPAGLAEYYARHPAPSFSADGRFEAHGGADGNGLFVRDLRTGEERAIALAKPLHCEDCIIDALAISPDGGTVVFNVRWFVTSEGLYCCGQRC